MSIRWKIILVVLPIMFVTLVLTGVSSFFMATTGITRIAKNFLGFKAEEMEKYARSQWALLEENGLTAQQEMLEATKSGIQNYATTVIRSQTELIAAFDATGNVAMSTKPITLTNSERDAVIRMHKEQGSQLATIPLAGRERVAKGFYFAPFDWYIMLTEEKDTFYTDVDQITKWTGIILLISSAGAVLLMLWFSGFLTSPLVKVVSAMKDIITSSNLSKRVLVEYQDEIGQLSHTFNIMTAELERAYTQIKRYAFEAVLAQKKEHRIRNIFQLYVPNDVIDQIFANPEEALVGDNRVLSILFSDIRSFTTISESMMPDDLVNNLNRYFSSMVDIIMNRNGIVDKYIGDAIMAFWGAPTKREDDAMQSVQAGLEMMDAVKVFNKNQVVLGKPPFNIGIGINYGVVTVGNIGSERKMNYTVIGDNVNLASRLEGLTKEYHQEILISESLHYKVHKEVPCRMLDTVAVKGKTKGVKIYTARRELTEQEKEAWKFSDEGFEKYYARGFEAAKSNFERVMTLLPGDFIAQMMMDRCDKLIANPPPKDWDGVDKKEHK